MSSKRPVSVFMGDALERRVNRHRIGGDKIRSFSDVAREAIEKGLDVMEREQQSACPGTASGAHAAA
ncbi:hypothetical protein WMF45_00185 [Sorangium sp. So ce448]|uniref:hypothetical protein n=1 Tax=Sorangium sp. So ce448 TaxID=3133314 RepID=UPI003F62F0BD